jgi:type I restriction enzyme S subunit
MRGATVRLRDVVEINPSSRLSDTSAKEVCFAAMADVSEAGRIVNFQMRPLHEVNKGYTSFCQGDVLLAKITPCFENGKAAVVEHLESSVGFGSTEFHVLRPNSEIDARFLFHLIWNPRFRRLGAARMTGSAGQKRVPTTFLAEYEFRLPKLAEQKRIAAILDKADCLRRKRQEAIRLADEFLRAVFIDMFGALDSQSHAPVSFGDVADLDAPMVDPTSDEYADLLHVGPDRIEKGNGQLLVCETARAEGLISKKFIFDERYVLYSKIRPALKKCALAEFRGLCSADMYPVRPVEGQVTREFIWGLLLSDAFDRYVDTLPDRANIPKLNRTELNAFQFRLPSINLQRKYSAVVRSTMNLKRKHRTFLAKADSLPVSFQFFN